MVWFFFCCIHVRFGCIVEQFLLLFLPVLQLNAILPLWSKDADVVQYGMFDSISNEEVDGRRMTMKNLMLLLLNDCSVYHHKPSKFKKVVWKKTSVPFVLLCMTYLAGWV